MRGVPERLEALLLVAALASLVLWLLGLAAYDRLGPTLLGQDLWHNHRLRVTLAELFDALKRLKLLVMQEAQYA